MLCYVHHLNAHHNDLGHHVTAPDEALQRRGLQLLALLRLMQRLLQPLQGPKPRAIRPRGTQGTNAEGRPLENPNLRENHGKTMGKHSCSLLFSICSRVSIGDIIYNL